ncbi:MAG: UDP-N-acetylenolpyruvoylglucosamine reductase, partial [Chitinophagales bacterium]
DENTIKIPAGWMIEQCGWKGFLDGDIGVHDKQALVLVNKGNGKGEDIKELAYRIQNSVMERFGVELIPEVNMI